MAETKEKKNDQAQDQAQDQTQDQTQEQASEKAPEQEELITIRLPITKEMQDDVFVRVNERTWLIKRGETVKLPACAVEVLEHSEQAMLEGLRYQALKESKN